jgi:penicillin-binding protein 1C
MADARCEVGIRASARVGLLVRLAALVALGAALSSCLTDETHAPDLEIYRARLAALDRRAFFQTTSIVDRHGQLLAEVAPRGRRTWVELARIPRSLQLAVIATEDRTFFANGGVDTGAVARAAVQNAQAGGTFSGASTITMQLVRLVAFEPEERFSQTLDRKVREAHLAAELAERLPKDDILAAYLNIAYFGRGAYGVEAAAQAYFDRHVWSLSLAQSALLAGLLQAPSALDPGLNPQGAHARQRVVLDAMVALGALDPAQADDAWALPLEIAPVRPTPERRAPHFVDQVLAALPDLIGPELAALGGFTVTTTIDVHLVEDLQSLAARHVQALRDTHDVSDAALVAIQPGTGQIVAMVGGLDYGEAVAGQVNMAASPRQVGSAFKPIAYAAALEAGWTPASVLWDVPAAFPIADGTVYTAANYDGRYRGPVRLRRALANSLNAASVDLLAEVGVARAHALALDLGLDLDADPWRYGLSLTLGGAESSLVALTGAYAALAGGGVFAPPAPVLRIVRISDGRSLFDLAPVARRVVSPQTAWLVTDILADADARRPAFAPGPPLATSRPSAVKTGTTDDFRDNLTVGFTSYLALGVWTGNKDGRPMRDVLGITGAAPIWHDAMERVFADPALRSDLGGGRPPVDAFTPPAGIVRADVCDLDGLGADGTCRRQVEVFAAGTVTDDVGTAYDWFEVRRDGTAGGWACAVPNRAGGRLYLLPPRDERVAAAARAYAGNQSLPIAPVVCPEHVADAGASGPAHGAP